MGALHHVHCRSKHCVPVYLPVSTSRQTVHLSRAKRKVGAKTGKWVTTIGGHDQMQSPTRDRANKKWHVGGTLLSHYPAPLDTIIRPGEENGRCFGF
jgi:hypothetical protein